MEAAFLVYRLPPCHRSWNKRVVKQPKLIFFMNPPDRRF